jgi:hypothetical protein
VDNRLLRNSDMRRGTTLLLLQILSHRPGWKTDTASLVKAGKEGRDAVLSMLAEMEDHRFMKRYRRQLVSGKWAWERWIFDHPATDEEVEALIAALPDAPPPDPDELDILWTVDDENPPEWASELASSQVKPSTGKPYPVQPSTEDQGISTLEDHVEKTKEGGSSSPTSPGEPGPKKAPPENPDHYDEHGRVTPRCDEHVGTYFGAPCGSCKKARLEFEESNPKRDAAKWKAKDAQLRAARAATAGAAPKPASFWDEVEAAQTEASS